MSYPEVSHILPNDFKKTNYCFFLLLSKNQPNSETLGLFKRKLIVAPPWNGYLRIHCFCIELEVESGLFALSQYCSDISFAQF